MVLVLMTMGTAAADTLYVVDGGYATIQEAVDAAIDGDTILVYPGTYVENVDINKELTIIAESGPDVTTVQGVPEVVDYVFELPWNETVNNVTISGFTVTGATSHNGIGVFDSSHNELRHNIISGGVTVVGVWDITMINNTVISGGIDLDSFCIGILENNEVFSSSWNGINIRGQSHVTLVNNTIYENDGTGIVMWDFADGYIYNNTIYGNEAGIAISRHSYGKIANNTIYGNDEVGIKISSDSWGDIYNNYFNNTMNAQIDEHAPSECCIGNNTLNTTKIAGTNIVGGPYLGGNFWANPNGTGFSQIGEDLDGDGICDLPYLTNENNIDYLPLCLFTYNPYDENEDCVIDIGEVNAAIDDYRT
ncbi:hypothetical protein HNV12_08810 [Methanococcoides sp. SA1]|nr:hypothetical protein [Methanococcoides sp. SA1]